jgi:hypothetical protein
MWHRSQAAPGSRYVLQLCQGPARVRYIRPREAEAGEPDPHRHLETEPFPGEWVTAYDFRAIGGVRLADERRYGLGAHGEWFTEEEMQALFEDRCRGPIPWHNGIVPNLPPE